MPRAACLWWHRYYQDDDTAHARLRHRFIYTAPPPLTTPPSLTAAVLAVGLVASRGPLGRGLAGECLRRYARTAAAGASRSHSTSTSSPPTLPVSQASLTSSVCSVDAGSRSRWARSVVSSGRPLRRRSSRLRIRLSRSMSPSRSASLSHAPCSPSATPKAIRSLIARGFPSASVVTICRHARLLCRYCSIAITASWRTKSASRQAVPRQDAARHRDSEITEASPLLSPRPGQK